MHRTDPTYLREQGTTPIGFSGPLLNALTQEKQKNNRICIANSFTSDLHKLMNKIQNDPHKRHYADLTKYLYSNVIPKDFSRSGSERAELLFSGMGDDHYSIPRAEAKFIERNSNIVCDFFRKNFPEKAVTHVSIGCGPYTPVFVKDVPISRACNIQEYIAVDINETQAKAAAQTVCQKVPNITSSYVAQDFTKPLRIETMSQNSTILMTMFGDTIGQFPHVNSHNNGTKLNAPTLKHLLRNFGQSTNYSGILLATLDAETNASFALPKYQGAGMHQLMLTLWGTAREVTGDNSFDPFSFSYNAEFESETNSILFVHTAIKNTSLVVRNKKYDIAKGTEIVIGCSQKTTPERILPLCLETGWVAAQVPFQYDSTTRAIVLVGRKLAKSLPHLQLCNA